MFKNYFYIRIICYIITLVGLSGLEVWLLTNNKSWLSIILIALGILISIVLIINLFNKVQQKISYSFNAIENRDSTLHFSEKLNYKPTRDLNKSLNRINMIVQEAQLKSKEQESYLKAILEQITTGVIVFNDKGNIIQANTAVKKLLNHYSLTHIVQFKQIDKSLYEAFQILPKSSKQLVKLTHENTIVQLSLHATNFEDRNTKLTLVAVQDINRELDTKELETWMKMSRVLTHEIMNSIAPITSLSETLINHYKKSTGKEEHKTANNILKGLEVIKERGLGLLDFVTSYRKLTKVSPPSLKTINLKQFIESIVMLMSNEVDYSNISFIQKTFPLNLTICADETQLSQVMINLIKNAIQAVNDVKNPTIKILAVKDSQSTKITVLDNGKGIPKEIIDQIFIPFFTTKSNGSGIGLSISRQIMRNHKGSIKVISRPQQGTKFILEI